MSMSQNELRRRGLNFVRRQVAAGKATEKDLKQWESELGPEVRRIAQEATPPKQSARTASKPDTTKES